MTNKLNVSLIGCGRIYKNHISAIENLNHLFTVDALCDTNPSVINSLKKDSKINIYDDFHDLINSTNSDLYVLCTPSGLHSEQAIKLLDLNRNVLCEKPVATNTKDSILLYEAIKRSNANFFTVLQNRFNPTVEKLKKILTEEKIGKVYQAVSNVLWTRPQSYYDLAPWRGTISLDGGAFLNQSSHYFDLLYHFFGKHKNIHSLIDTKARKIEAEDTGAAIIEFESGVLGSINVSMLTYPKNFEGSFTIIAEKGTIKLGGSALNKFEYIDSVLDEDEFYKLNYEIPNIYGYGHLNVYENVYNYLVKNIYSHLLGDEGFYSFNMIMDCYNQSKLYNKK